MSVFDFALPLVDINAEEVASLWAGLQATRRNLHGDKRSAERLQLCAGASALHILHNLLLRFDPEVVQEQIALISAAIVRSRIDAGVAGTGNVSVCVTWANIGNVVLALRERLRVLQETQSITADQSVRGGGRAGPVESALERSTRSTPKMGEKWQHGLRSTQKAQKVRASGLKDIVGERLHAYQHRDDDGQRQMTHGTTSEKKKAELQRRRERCLQYGNRAAGRR
jgi:hypothetical protein